MLVREFGTFGLAPAGLCQHDASFDGTSHYRASAARKTPQILTNILRRYQTNSKFQVEMTETLARAFVPVLSLGFWSFVLVSDFEIRISDLLR